MKNFPELSILDHPSTLSRHVLYGCPLTDWYEIFYFKRFNKHNVVVTVLNGIRWSSRPQHTSTQCIQIFLFIWKIKSKQIFHPSNRDDDVQFVADDNHNFDLLIFTQVWPVTGCISWMEQGHSHTCILPSPKEIWTIHGVWPTRFGTMGPAFCNSSATFDVNTLRPFEDQLKQFWMNIHKGERKCW